MFGHFFTLKNRSHARARTALQKNNPRRRGFSPVHVPIEVDCHRPGGFLRCGDKAPHPGVAPPPAVEKHPPQWKTPAVFHCRKWPTPNLRLFPPAGGFFPRWECKTTFVGANSGDNHLGSANAPRRVENPRRGAKPPAKCKTPRGGEKHPRRCETPAEVQNPRESAKPPRRCKTPAEVQNGPAEIQPPRGSAKPPGPT